MSTDLLALFGAIQRGDTREIASHIFPSAIPEPQQPRNRISSAPVEGSSPNAGIGTADAGTSYPVTCRARYYDAASRILEDELQLFTSENTDELGLVIEQWIEKKRANWEPR